MFASGAKDGRREEKGPEGEEGAGFTPASAQATADWGEQPLKSHTRAK